MTLAGVIIQTLGGLGLFILGMKMMTDGLQLSAGDRIKKILSAVSKNRIIGCATGAGVTALVQSSSATTVMLISFVGAGLMNLQQAVSVILGANIGTTVTAQIIAFKLTNAALPAIAIGVTLKFFSKRKRYRYIGEIILGFGLLFYGMTIMKHGLSPIKQDPAFVAFFTQFTGNTMGSRLLCVATGALLTIMVQSSSATIGLTMTLATQGLLTFPAAAALVLGENIGTTITAELATIGSSNINAHRAARAHTMFNVIGVCIIFSVFPYFVAFIEMITPLLGAGPLTEVVEGEVVNISRYIANGHTAFNIINAFIFLILLRWLIKVASFLSPREKQEPEDLFQLPKFDNRYVDNPIAAMTQVRSEIVRMAETALHTLNNTMEAFRKNNPKALEKWYRYEQHLDAMQRAITIHLTQIFQGDVNPAEAKELSGMMRITNNIERIGDSVENIALIFEDILDDRITFSDRALSDINTISEEATAFLIMVKDAIQKKPPHFWRDAQILENNIDIMREEMRDAHIERLQKGVCSNQAGLMFSDILSNFEKIGDYCYNIAQAIEGIKY